MTLGLSSAQATIVSSLILGAALTFYGVLTYDSHRFVHVPGSTGRVLDSRTGCIWQMNTTPPSRRCPGDRESASRSVTELTPEEFMRRQGATPKQLGAAQGTEDNIFDWIAKQKRRKPVYEGVDQDGRTITFTDDDIVSVEQMKSVKQGISGPEDIQPHNPAPSKNTDLSKAEAAKVITEFVLSIGVGVAALLFAFSPLLKKARRLFRAIHKDHPE